MSNSRIHHRSQLAAALTVLFCAGAGAAGHAVAQTLPLLDDAGVVLVLYGDVPLMTQQTLTLTFSSAGVLTNIDNKPALTK